MSGMNNPIIFYIIAILMIFSAVLAIYFKNIFYSLLSAVIVFFSAGIFFYLLGSEYNAVIQIAIYGIAVPIVLGLAIMFTDMKNDNNIETKPSNLSFVLFFIALLFILVLLTVISPYEFEELSLSKLNIHSNILAFGEGIYIKYVYAFEFVSLLLTMIIVGLTMLKREKDSNGGGDLCKK